MVVGLPERTQHRAGRLNPAFMFEPQIGGEQQLSARLGQSKRVQDIVAINEQTPVRKSRTPHARARDEEPDEGRAVQHPGLICRVSRIRDVECGASAACDHAQEDRDALEGVDPWAVHLADAAVGKTHRRGKRVGIPPAIQFQPLSEFGDRACLRTRVIVHQQIPIRIEARLRLAHPGLEAKRPATVIRHLDHLKSWIILRGKPFPTAV